MALSNRFKSGDWIIYRKTKHSLEPGPRAENVSPSTNGDLHTYTVDKFWIVVDVNEDGSLMVETRRGKQHIIAPETPCLRKPNWFERLRHRSRFEAVEQQLTQANSTPSQNREAVEATN